MASDPFNTAAINQEPAQPAQSTTTALESTQRQRTSGAEVPRALPQAAESANPNLNPGTNPRADGKTPAETAQQVTQAVEQLNEMMQSGEQSLRFAVDDSSGRMVVQVMDVQTDEVIRQIPSEETLRFAEYVDGLVGMIFNKKA